MGLSDEEWTVELINRLHRQNGFSDTSRRQNNYQTA